MTKKDAKKDKAEAEAAPAEDEEEEEEVDDKDKTAKQEAKQLDSLTDHAEEKEASVDKDELQKRLAELMKVQAAKAAETSAREAELAAVKIKKEDVDVMVQEFPHIEKEQHERVLREHKGELVPALRHLVTHFPEMDNMVEVC